MLVPSPRRIPAGGNRVLTSYHLLFEVSSLGVAGYNGGVGLVLDYGEESRVARCKYPFHSLKVNL